MYRVYYAGKRSVPMVNETNTARTDFGNLICDLQMGWEFYSEYHNNRDFNLSETHTLVGVVSYDTPESAWIALQGENVSPEFAEFIRLSDATHTSMSVGDVLVEVETGKHFFCDRIGFKEI